MAIVVLGGSNKNFLNAHQLTLVGRTYEGVNPNPGQHEQRT